MADAAALTIPPLPARKILVPIVSTAPLIVHRFSEKAKAMMLDAQQGRKKIKENRDPVADYEASRYRTDDGGDGFPTVGFKAASVSAARYFDKSVTMTIVRQSLFMKGDHSKLAGQMLTRINGTPHMREDMVRLGISSTDLRYRAEFPEWTATLTVVFVSSMVSTESVLALLDGGGMGVGVGEWRPEKGGEFGTYMVDRAQEIEVIE